MTVTAQDNQSIYDITAQNFGTLDNLVDVSNDNGLSLSGLLTTGQELTINNSGLGEADIKKYINENEITFNNNYSPILLVWILATGYWNDLGVWIDTETWID